MRTRNNSAKRLLSLTAALLVGLMMPVLSYASGTGDSDPWHIYPTLGASSGDVFTYSEGMVGLTLESEGEAEKFVSFSIDGRILADSVYIVSDTGSTQVTVGASYLGALDPGDHSIRFVFTDGETIATLHIESGTGAATAAQAEAQQQVQNTPAPAANSGDSGGLAQGGGSTVNTGLGSMAIGFLAMSGGAAAVFGLARKWE